MQVIGNAPPTSFVDTENVTLLPSTSASEITPAITSAQITSDALSETLPESASSEVITSDADITSAPTTSAVAAATSASEIIDDCPDESSAGVASAEPHVTSIPEGSSTVSELDDCPEESESVSGSDSAEASVTVVITSAAAAATSVSASDGIECPDESESVSSGVSVTTEIGEGAFASVTDGSQAVASASVSVNYTGGSSGSITVSATVEGQSASASTPASSASSSTPTSALVGSDGVAKCTDYKCNSGADWLVSALCAIAKCNHMWPLSLVSDMQGDLYDTTRATFTVWSAPLQLNTSIITFDEANTVLADNSAEGGWLGGAIDVAVEKMGGDGVYYTTDGEGGYEGKILMSSKTEANRTRVEEAGVWGLVYLTGLYAVRESIPEDDATWLDFMQKVNGSPVLIYTTDTPDSSLIEDQYYTVITITNNSNVTLWDPYGEGINAYKYIDISTLKTSSKWIYHLDWPHFLWPNDS
ncbi:hypothetical protein C349_00502 [Cryptococcus neoformans var. grubii Br795]|nr:hypothetical protein C349_00502 [Cryptococcus neoformans var. grubii Br795]